MPSVRSAPRLAIAVAERSASGDSNVHIGIATGTVVVGGGEAAERGPARSAEAEVSAVGSALNLAARLQPLAEPGMVVVSAETRRLAGGLFEYRDLGRHALKGFDAAVPAWQVVGERGVRSRFHALRASNLTPFVGRQAALDALHSAWDAVRQGSGQAVLVTGEPGLGKSRLAEVVDGRIVGRDCMRLWYYCSPNLQGSPFAPVIRYLSFAAGLSASDDNPTRLAKLAAFLPEAPAPQRRRAAAARRPAGDRCAVGGAGGDVAAAPPPTAAAGADRAAARACAARPGAAGRRRPALDRPLERRADGADRRCAADAAAAAGADGQARVPAAMGRAGARAAAGAGAARPRRDAHDDRPAVRRACAAGGDGRADRRAHRRPAAVRRGPDARPARARHGSCRPARRRSRQPAFRRR